LYVLILVFFIFKFRKYAFIPIIGLALSVGAADYITSGIIKPSVDRVRPCNVPELQANIHAPCRNSPSFPSSHAANHFAIAIFLSFFLNGKWRAIKYVLYVWAFAIAYSRVYVGVHYPFDVTMGAIIGGTLGLLFAKASTHLIQNKKH
jgi:undecaprenyl-diphosphatase